jgi:glycosyltransferase involved in cell wall biosynthesis
MLSSGSAMPPGVTVVVPVHDAGALLTRCLESLAAQDLPPHEFEVVAVDDGSADGSGERLDRYAAGRSNVRVIHQRRSGGPGGPRNAGTDAARGDFVFYLDADDALAPDALRRMLTFARASASDLVTVGRVVLAADRVVVPLVPRPAAADARLSDAFRSLTPHKLIRRQLLVDHSIRFPEGRVTFEDGIFLARVAPRARRISALEDRGYYLKHRHAARLSRAIRVPTMAAGAMEIIGILRALGADPAEADLVAFRLWRRMLRSWNSQRFLGLDPALQDSLVATMREAARTLGPAGSDACLRHALRLRSLAFRTGSTRVVLALAEVEHDHRPGAQLSRPPLLPVLARAWLIRAHVAAGRHVRRARARLRA